LPVRSAVTILASAIEVIQGQTLTRRELIVIDGGSTDGTIDVLCELGDRIDCWSSARARGIYDATNRRIDATRGHWPYFMGVDDAFYDRQTIADVMHMAAASGNPDLLYGNVLLGRQGRSLEVDSTTAFTCAKPFTTTRLFTIEGC
jgi:glycosyltransferase involved in cell wall biosynthesis